ncbi:helix-turn-helix transcriptional regulator [Phascolarctobacterium sp.]|uniref:helix-turn-helix domain-containing protein n=1 Tax=Phascolarctobacterium sp. TaxID=2049039 RepID=UPI003077C53C
MFNVRLREKRMEAGLTQQKISDLIGVALRTYQCYEGGTRSPSYDLLVKIADILNVSTDYLLCRDNFIKAHEECVDEP